MDAGLLFFRPRDRVIQIRLRCRHAAARKLAYRAEHLNSPALVSSWSPPCRADRYGLPVDRIAYKEPPLPGLLLLGGLAGYVCDNGSEPAKVAWVLCQTGKRARSTRMSTIPFATVPWAVPFTRSKNTSARSWSIVRSAPSRRSIFAMWSILRFADSMRAGGRSMA